MDTSHHPTFLQDDSSARLPEAAPVLYEGPEAMTERTTAVLQARERLFGPLQYQLRISLWPREASEETKEEFAARVLEQVTHARQHKEHPHGSPEFMALIDEACDMKNATEEFLRSRGHHDFVDPETYGTDGTEYWLSVEQPQEGQRLLHVAWHGIMIFAHGIPSNLNDRNALYLHRALAEFDRNQDGSIQ